MTVDADVFFKRVFELWKGYLRPIEAGNCQLARIGKGEDYCRSCELLSSGWWRENQTYVREKPFQKKELPCQETLMSTSTQQGKDTRLLVVHAARQFLGREVNIFATFFTTIIHKCRLFLVRFPERLLCTPFRLHSYHTWRCRLESVREGQPIGNYLAMFEPNRRAENSLLSILAMEVRTESRTIHQCSSKLWRLRSGKESGVIVANLN